MKNPSIHKRNAELQPSQWKLSKQRRYGLLNTPYMTGERISRLERIPHRTCEQKLKFEANPIMFYFFEENLQAMIHSYGSYENCQQLFIEYMNFEQPCANKILEVNEYFFQHGCISDGLVINPHAEYSSCQRTPPLKNVGYSSIISGG